MDKTEEAKLTKLVEQGLEAFKGEFHVTREEDRPEGVTVDVTEDIPTRTVAEVLVDSILARYRLEVREESHGYKCVVCHKVPVDVEGGYDTCPECARRT